MVGREPLEVWYIDGSRAADNELDIVDVCDSMIQAEYEYAFAVYNDVLVVHALALTSDFQGLGLEARIIRKIADTVGYHCAAIVFDPDRAGITNDDELELSPTKNSSLFALTDF